jgi:hypothetical protein
VLQWKGLTRRSTTGTSIFSVEKRADEEFTHGPFALLHEENKTELVQWSVLQLLQTLKLNLASWPLCLSR